ncbi:hypothetical protein GCM10007978_14380 [Shewanella hanedai]|uniref:Carbohydrate-binding protein n=1 Tax=Shewanella hanedai TaxID=25 RepID=A0A553JQ48_SHEHA|nr:hypothetical protein [Shewanella hanedai]TRY14589.1 hypothetical protein FN961_09315 [Shewanella hanedai]GGI77830.1 hypothetical protein GCM10007978_14380 [Shewanella hanedai]
MTSFKLSLLASSLILAASAFSTPAFATNNSVNLANTMNTIHQKIDDRIAELREYASDESNVIIQDQTRYIKVNNSQYELTQDNYIMFDLPSSYTDGTAFRNVFDFIDDDWEISWYGFGMVLVNKIYGNYNYGNGCLIEYGPRGDVYTPTGSKHLVIETASCGVEEGETLTEKSFLGEGRKLDYSTFGYESADNFSPESVAINRDKVYVGNVHSSFSKIERFDLKTQQALPAITGFTLNGIDETYRVVSDVTEHNGRLYVASLSSNRVDIYDTTNNDNIVMSLGTGSWSGNTFDKTLTHPHSVAANNDYIFVADVSGKISVYAQSDVKQANHKNTKKHAFLSLPESNSIYRNLKMEVVGNELIASFDSSATYVFDIANIEAGQHLIEPKQTYAKTHRRNVYESARGDVFTGSTSGNVELFPAGTLVFTDSGVATPSTQQYSAYFDINTNTEATSKVAFDLAVENDILAMLQDRTVLLADIETLRIHQSNNTVSYTNDIDLTGSDVSHTPLLFNGESWESLTTNHEVRINRLLSGKQTLDALEITSYVAQPTHDLTVEARFNNDGAWVQLGSITQLDAFSSFKLGQTLQDNLYYPTANGLQSVAIKGLTDLSYLPANIIDIRLTSKTDELVKKITDLKPKWRLRFGTFNTGNWAKITPAYAREWMIIIANFAYMIDSPEFEHLWFNYRDSIGQGNNEFFGNAGPIDGSGGNFTAEDYKRVYDEFMNRDLINLGISTIGGGLGGGTTLGIDTWNYYSHYYNSGMGVVGHEFGHHWGSHDSSFSNSSRGLQLMTQDLHQMMIRCQSLPYLDDEINAFYKTPREEMYNGVDHRFRTPRPADNVNLVEGYFAEKPLLFVR